MICVPGARPETVHLRRSVGLWVFEWQRRSQRVDRELRFGCEPIRLVMQTEPAQFLNPPATQEVVVVR